MNGRTLLLALFTLTGVLIELGLFMVFIDLSMRGRATPLWSFSLWPFVVFPLLCGWLFFARKWVAVTWTLMLGSCAYCLWYFLSEYGTGLFRGSMLIIGVPAVVVVGSLIGSAAMFRDWPKLRAA
jgi:hypothetical protein